MNYEEYVKWLFELVPSYQQVGKTAYKENFENISQFCTQLGNPQNEFKSIHIAGTNGKGSTSHMLASIFQEANFKTGLHTSPHLIDFRERNKINGKPITKEFVKDFLKSHQDYILNNQLSFFEVTVAMGFLYFATNKVDIAIIETGLGGRLDATNIILPELSIITNIGLDHTHILGETVQDIALEKAGIIKEKTPVLIGDAHGEVRKVFKQKANAHHAPIIFAKELEIPNYQTDLKGNYQIYNVRTAVSAIQILQKKAWKISKENIYDGLQKVVQNTGLRGRWEILHHNPFMVVDTAHNVEGIKQIIQQIEKTPHKNLHLVLGFVNDKDVKSILQLFPKNASYYFCQPNIPRKMPVQSLKEITSKLKNTNYFETVREAINAAKNSAKINDMIFVGGSTFVVAEVLAMN